MKNKDDKVRVASSHMAAVRRIHEIEQKALKKIGTHRANTEGPACSFCGKIYDQSASLVDGSGSAKICVDCLGIINEILLDD